MEDCNKEERITEQQFIEGAKTFGVMVDECRLIQLREYSRLLQETNRVMNLTAITEYPEVLLKHFLDSLAIASVWTPADKAGYLLDIGTGAGFPGMVLKICFPELKVVLMDSLDKRVRFLQSVIEALGLSNCTAVHFRAEEAARKEEYREQFDWVCSRAVARLCSLTELCLPYVKKDGFFCAYKADGCEAEVEEAGRAVKTLGGIPAIKKELILPGSAIKRVLVLVKKEHHTPGKYPRGGGKPLKAPII